RQPELTIEIPQEALRVHGLTVGEVARRVRSSARDLVAGGVRTEGGEYRFRLSQRKEQALAYEDVPLVTLDDGSRLRLAEIGQVRDGFEDKNFENWFNGGRGIFLSVYQMGDEKPLDVARAVHEYIETIEPTLPEGVGISVLR